MILNNQMALCLNIIITAAESKMFASFSGKLSNEWKQTHCSQVSMTCPPFKPAVSVFSASLKKKTGENMKNCIMDMAPPSN